MSDNSDIKNAEEKRIRYALPIRIYIEDTDAGGIVFYANYLKFFERARTELVRSLGYELRAGMNCNINYVVHSLDVKYIKPATLDDLITVHAQVEQVGRTFFKVRQWATNASDDVLVEGNVKIACTHLDSGKPRVLPDDLANILV